MTIEGAFLKIEQSEVSISQSDELIQLYGNIGREPNKGERVIINIVYPDGTTNGHTLIPAKDGYFEIPEGSGLGARVDPLIIELYGKKWSE